MVLLSFPMGGGRCKLTMRENYSQSISPPILALTNEWDRCAHRVINIYMYGKNRSITSHFGPGVPIGEIDL